MGKVIFLDIDGVLNSNFWNADHQREISDGKYIDTEKVRLLSKLVKKAEAEIILHSGCRESFRHIMLILFTRVYRYGLGHSVLTLPLGYRV
jgi:hypothetical protein